MSLITRCPACETMFKVVPDQLRISDGWVRCGQCSEIFNASQHLVSTGEPPIAARPAPGATAAASAPPHPAGSYDVPPFTQAPMPQPPAAFAQRPFDPPGPPVDDTAASGTPDMARPAPALVPEEPRWIDPPAEVAATAAFTIPAVQEQGPTPEPGAEAQTADAASAPEPDVSFMRQGAGSGFWSRRAVRVVLALLALALAAALAVQVLLHERNRIVLIEPVTRPVLAALCAMARCDLGPLRQIESIVIDSSSFGRLRADSFRLGFSLRNTAPVDVAMPAIELSLTDTQDQALIRRVILPAEFGAPATALAAGSDWSGSLALSVRPAANTERIAGYRLLAFYP